MKTIWYKNTDSAVDIKGITMPLVETEEVKKAYEQFEDIESSQHTLRRESLRSKKQAELYQQFMEAYMDTWGAWFTVLDHEDENYLTAGWHCYQCYDCKDKKRLFEYFVYATPESIQAMQINIKEAVYMSYDEMWDYCGSQKDADGFCGVCNSCSGPCQSNLASDYPCPENVKRYRGGHWGGCLFEIWVGDEQ